MLSITIKSITNSTTLMTLFSLVSKPLNFVLLMPILLHTFSAEEIALWYLFGIIINMQVLADFGFYNTFVRVIALSLSGGCHNVEDLRRIKDDSRIIGEPNLDLAGKIIGTMRRTYIILSIVIFLILILFSPALNRNVNMIEEPLEGWISWCIVIVFTTINFAGRPYSNYLLGLNEVALVRKWEGFFNIAALLINVIVLLITKSLLWLVITNQIWILVNVLRNKYLCNHNKKFVYSSFSNYGYNKSVMKVVWPVAWKAGISSLTSQGVVSLSGVIFAQIGDAVSTGSYLFADKVYNAIRSFAMAPFYSKIPLLVKFRGQNKINEWIRVSQRGMFLASSMMVLAIIVLDVWGQPLFSLIKSNIDFPSHLLWLLLGWAYLLHRYGAMHTQLYTTINIVNSHISDLIAGVIMIIIWYTFIDKLNVLVFPIGMLCGYLFFYIWYAGYYSYNIMNCSILSYEKKANLVPVIVLALYTLIRFCK